MAQKIMVGMSGGVDSSVAAYLLKEQGYQPGGVTLRLFENEDIGISADRPCCSLDDVEDARAVARRLDIDHHVFNFLERFRNLVIEPFICCYECGGTPNPCIECNRTIKFRELLLRARQLGYDGVATGHYARISQDSVTGRWLLYRAQWKDKDQSYVLYTLTQDQLGHTLFPLGGYSKDEVRTIAETQGFVNAHKHDSQDICFVPDGDYPAFMERYTGKAYPPGDFVTADGAVVGRHKGLVRYTIGQRRGLGFSLPAPLYVLSKDIQRNTVLLGPNEALFRRELDADHLNLISCERLDAPIRVKAKIRYRHAEQWATVTQTGEDRLHVIFDEPQRAITPGQAVVLYDGDLVVGGGTILST